MTLTVQIEFKHSLPLGELFPICQKAVNTPEGVKPEVSYLGTANPPFSGADCWLGVSDLGNGDFRLLLDIPYVNARKMHSVAQRVLDSLGVTEYLCYNEFNDTWHDNLDWLKPALEKRKQTESLISFYESRHKERLQNLIHPN